MISWVSMNRTRKLFDLIGSMIVLAGLAGGIYYFKSDLNDLWRQSAAQFLPCSVPIRYSIDQFDERFGLSEQEFLEIVDRAAQAWSKAVDKTLFVYSEKGELDVNLIYDYRQEATDKLKGMGLIIKSGRESYNQLKSDYEKMKNTLESKQAAHESDVAAFERRAEKYEAEVNKWNEKAGAPPAIYDQLNAEKRNLDASTASLKVRSEEINSDVDDLNAVVTVLNRVASHLNLDAEEFNKTVGTRGEKFQEGEYFCDGKESRINIYEFENEVMLLRVLMHEFGHALGLGHLPDEDAIMYELNLGQDSYLSDSDRAAIQAHCR